MDTTAIQQEIDALQSQITTEETTLQEDNAKLESLKAQLAQATTVNAIEAITDLAAVNSALEADNSNFRVQDITPVPEPTQPAA